MNELEIKRQISNLCLLYQLHPDKRKEIVNSIYDLIKSNNTILDKSVKIDNSEHT